MAFLPLLFPVARGGGTVPSNPATQQDIKIEISQSKTTLSLLFNNLATSYKAGTAPGYYSKLFGGPKTIFDVIQSAQIELKQVGPCIDPNTGDEVDGSAPGSNNNSICLSLDRLTQKLSKDNVYTQTLGLIAHEFSHLVGANESEADEIQKLVVDNLRYTTTLQALNMVMSMRVYVETSQEQLMQISDNLNQWNLTQLTEEVGKIYQGPATSILWPFNVFTPEMHLSFKAIGIKAEVLYGQLCAKWCSEKNQKNYFQTWIGQIFQADSEIDLPTLQKRLGMEVTSNPPGFLIRKVNKVDEITEELEDIFFSNVNQFEYLEKMEKLSQ